MELRGIEFGHVFCASGARNFDGNGYPFHEWIKPFGLDYRGSTLVTKTTTLAERPGYMPLRSDGITPQETFPACIVVKPFKGVALNAVGLSGPGAPELFASGMWKRREQPFVISYMSVGPTPKQRADELMRFCNILQAHEREFKTHVAVQINWSCPNTGHEMQTLVDEVEHGLDIVGKIDRPVIPKFNALLPVRRAKEIMQHPCCDALCMSNTLPWGSFPNQIDWKALFGSTKSPLDALGGGGLSGKPLLPIVRDWIREARGAGIQKPIIGCGGILSSADADVLLDAGASAVELGSVSLLRPWRVQGIIQHVNARFEQRSV